MISDKAKEQAVEVIIKGIKDWESVKAARDFRESSCAFTCKVIYS